MKKLTSVLLCLTLLLTMAVPVHAEEGSSEPSGETPVTDHVCNFQLQSDSATCSAVGVKTYACTCGEIKTEDSPLKDHSFGAAVNVDVANHKKICSVCQQESMAAHSWDAGRETTPATCKQEGVKTYTCADCGATKNEAIPKLSTHSYGAWTKTSSAHSRSCTVCGAVENGNHSLKEEVIKEATCKEDGSKKKSCTVCDYSETIVLTKKKEHTYDNACDGECNVCGINRDVQHTYTTVWSSSSKGHWHECTKCEDQKDFSKHVPGPAATEEKAQVCTVCNYVVTPKKDHVHSYGEEWTSDEVGHWHRCTSCHKEKDYASHAFDDECDDDCNTCGYKRKNSHSYDKEGWNVSAFDHWNICSVCGEESKKEKHVPGPAATDKDPQLCTVCGYELAPVTEHSHDFGNGYLASETDHWQECKCGEKSVPMAHSWDEGKENRNDTVTFTCTVCGAEKIEAVKSSGFPWLILVLVILALICIGGIVAIVIMLKRGDFEDDADEADADEEGFEQETEAEVDEEEKMIDDYFASIDEDLYK